MNIAVEFCSLFLSFYFLYWKCSSGLFVSGIGADNISLCSNSRMFSVALCNNSKIKFVSIGHVLEIIKQLLDCYNSNKINETVA